MNEQILATLREALSHWKGDDLERAQAAFRGMSDWKLDCQHGQSGQTRREVLAGYVNHRQRHDEASAWVEDQARAALEPKP